MISLIPDDEIPSKNSPKQITLVNDESALSLRAKLRQEAASALSSGGIKSGRVKPKKKKVLTSVDRSMAKPIVSPTPAKKETIRNKTQIPTTAR